MSIEKRNTKAGGYYVKYYPNGSNHPPERIPVATYTEAVTLDTSLKRAKGKEPAEKCTFPRLADVVDDYLAWCDKQWSAYTCKKKRRRLLHHIIPFFGKYRVRDLDQRIFDQYANQHKKWTYNSDLIKLLAFISWMVSRNYAEALTFKPEKLKGSHAIKPVPHPADLMQAIESIKKERYRILFKLMLFTGLRWNEARCIVWQDINLRTGSIRIREVIDGPQDIVYIPEPLKTWFKDNHQPTGYVFESVRKGQPVNNIWSVLHKAGAAYGLQISSHTLRHASGTYLYESTDDIYKVQAHLRHRNIVSTQIYTRMSVARRKNANTSVVDYIVNNLNDAND